METFNTLDSDFREGFGFNREITSYLLETAKWSKFLSIVGFVFIGIMILVALFIGSIMGTAFSAMPMDDTMPYSSGIFTGMMTGIYLFLALLYFFPTLYLYRFSTQVKTAIHTNSQEELTQSFSNLKSMFKFWGIFTAVTIGIYALIFLLGILGGIGSMM